MRPTEKPTGAVWELLKRWRDRERFKPTQLEMADLFEVSKSLLTQWKYMESAMQTDDMKRVSAETGISLEMLAAAVAEDDEAVRAYVARRKERERRRMSHDPPEHQSAG